MFRNITSFSVVLIILVGTTAFADTDAAKQYNLDKSHLALSGYDPVAYFDGGKPTEGKANIVARYNGAIYHFASEEHRNAFQAEPTKYAPTYGGWCATAMADGKKVEIDPKNFKVTNGRLFLFYKDFFTDARKKWLKDEAGLAAKADAAWKQIAGE